MADKALTYSVTYRIGTNDDDITYYRARCLEIPNLVGRGPDPVSALRELMDRIDSKFSNEDLENMSRRYRHRMYCVHCKKLVFYRYTLKDDVWAKTGLGPRDGVLHLECVEKLIGRELAVDDLREYVNPNQPIMFFVNKVLGKC